MYKIGVKQSDIKDFTQNQKRVLAQEYLKEKNRDHMVGESTSGVLQGIVNDLDPINEDD